MVQNCQNFQAGPKVSARLFTAFVERKTRVYIVPFSHAGRPELTTHLLYLNRLSGSHDNSATNHIIAFIKDRTLPRSYTLGIFIEPGTDAFFMVVQV